MTLDFQISSFSRKMEQPVIIRFVICVGVSRLTTNAYSSSSFFFPTPLCLKAELQLVCTVDSISSSSKDSVRVKQNCRVQHMSIPPLQILFLSMKIDCFFHGRLPKSTRLKIIRWEISLF